MYNSLLLSGNGSNNANNNSFVDSSSNNFAITRNGNTTQGTFTPYGENWSNYFATTGSYLSVPYSSDLNLTGNFTIEFWINPTNLPPSTGPASQSYCRLFSFGTYNAANSLGLEINSNNSAYVRRLISWYNGSSYELSSNNAIASNTWQHVALVRNGTTVTCYVDGVSTGTITGASAAVNTSQSLYIGSLQSFEADSSAQYVGYISNFSILKGTAKYTSNFTPTTSPLPTNSTNQSLLTCYSNRFYDANTTTIAKTITPAGTPTVQRFSPFSPTAAYSTSTIGGSGYFDGNGDYLTSPYSTSLVFGTNDFTIECWMYLTDSSVNARRLFALGDGANGGSVYETWELRYYGTENSGQVGIVRFDGSVYEYATTGASVTANAWYHIAASRTGGTLKIFVNGIAYYSAANTLNFSAVNSNNFYVALGYYGPASGYSGPRYFPGYISNIRVINGTGIYSSNFTPPTAPLTAVTNTQILLNYANAGIIDNTMLNNLETVGSAQISTGQTKFGGSSMAFDGTGDYLTMPSSPQYSFGTGDFTVEGWFYINAGSGSNNGALQISSTAGGLQASQINTIALSSVDSGGLKWSAYYGNTYANGSTAIAQTWTHVALVRASGSLKLYINGTVDATFGTKTDTTNYTGQNIAVGGYFSTTYLWNGYIDDLRITRGYARYTANFTPPVSAFSQK
jgi:hypothetical protein